MLTLKSQVLVIFYRPSESFAKSPFPLIHPNPYHPPSFSWIAFLSSIFFLFHLGHFPHVQLDTSPFTQLCGSLSSYPVAPSTQYLPTNCAWRRALSNYSSIVFSSHSSVRPLSFHPARPLFSFRPRRSSSFSVHGTFPTHPSELVHSSSRLAISHFQTPADFPPASQSFPRTENPDQNQKRSGVNHSDVVSG